MPHINSRYRIIRVLGENPDGGVFLAEDTLFGNTQIALKTIRSTGIDDRHLNALRDEFFMLSRFKHPNIAQVFEFGTIQTTDMPGYAGNFFFTLEYIEGKDLYRFTEGADAACIAELLFQTAHALAYIHRHGLIHFDIKPSNIIVTRGLWGDEAVPVVKIIDFGFASSTIASIDQPIRGTLNYIAPELLQGDAYDERIDLYSLGASLYEIIAREPLFSGADTTTVIKQHLSSPVPDTRAKRPDLPEYLHALTAQLLQKDPSLRLSSAEEMIGRMCGMFPRDTLFHNILVHIPLHALVGREEETLRLLRFLGEGLGGEPGGGLHPAFFISGETGIGKTSLLHEVRRRAQAGGMVVFDTQCFARHAQPYEPMLKILRDQTAYVTSFGARGNELLAQHEEFLSIACPADPERNVDTIARHTDDPEKRLHFVDMWADCFFDMAAISPYAVLLDNIDNADESTLELLQYLLRNARTRKVRFIIAGVTDAKIGPLMNAAADTQAERLELRALDEAAVQKLLGVLFDIGPDGVALSRAIIQKIGGAPSIVREFLSQYANAPKETVVQAIASDIAHLSGSFAHTITQLYEQKLSRRKPEELFILRLMSCFEAPVALRLLEALSPFAQHRLRNFLGLLVNLGIVRPLENGGRYYLSQSQFQSYVYAQIGDERMMLHALIAETMSNDAGAPAQHAEAIANHYKHAGDAANAYTYFRRAASLKRAHYALHESIALLNEACMCMPPEETDLSVYDELAQSYSQAGDYKNAVMLYEQLRMDAGESKRYTYAKELGLIHTREGRLEEAVACLSEASALAQTVEETIDVEEELTIIDMSRGKYTEAFDRCTRVLKEHAEAMNSVAITGILNNLGIIHFYQNHFDDAAACFSQSITILQNEGQKSKLIGPYLNLGNVHGAQGQFAEAARHWQHALLLAQEVGNLQQEARAYNNIGIAAFNQGHLDEASQHYEKAYGIFSRLGFAPGMALCLTNIGEVHLANVDYESAIECWEKDLQLYTSLQDDHGITEIDLQLAAVRLIFGEIEQARQLVDDADRLLGTNGITTQHALAHYVRGCLNLACDAHHDACAELEQARTLYKEAKDHRSCCLALLKLAEAEEALGRDAAALSILEEARALGIEHRYPLIEAEALFLTGGLAAKGGAACPKPPILLYLHAFEVIQTQNVSEVTWQICHALGREFLNRGLHEKGRLYLEYAKQSLDYIGGKITSPSLRTRYYTSCRRGAISCEIDRLIGEHARM